MTAILQIILMPKKLYFYYQLQDTVKIIGN